MSTVIDQKLVDDFESFVSGDSAIDRHDVFRRCRHDAPVLFSDALDAWVLTRHADVKAVLADEARFATLRDGPGAPVYGNSVLQWRGSEHQRKGGLVAKRLRSPRAVQEFDSFVALTCDRLASELVQRNGPVDLKADYAMWIPLLVIGELMAIEGAEKFRDWYHQISAGGVSSIGHPEKRADAFVALHQLWDFLDPVIDDRRANPGDDLLSDLCTATFDGEPMPTEQIRALTGFLLTAGVETTERALSSLLVHLIATPELIDALREDPGKVTAALAESLRVFPSVHGSTRQALQDVEVHGATISQGDRIVPLIASANRDETVFTDPDSFRLDRFADDADRQFTNAGSILPFGAGRHHCTGSQLARIEMLHGVRALLDHTGGIAFSDGVPPAMDGFLLVSPAAVPVVLHAP